MQESKKAVFSFLLFLLINYCSIGQTIFDNDIAPTQINYKSYTDLDGLSSNGICVLYQDTAGFLWVGTSNGLNRFDGTTFKKYFARIPNFENSLIDNYIISITQYRHYLLIGSLQGISVLNLKTEKFENNYLFDNFRIPNLKANMGFYKVENYFALITDFTFSLYNSDLKLLHTIDYTYLKKTNNRFYFGTKNLRILNNKKLQIQANGGYQYLDLANYSLSNIDLIPGTDQEAYKYQQTTNQSFCRDSLVFKTIWQSNLSFSDNENKILYQIIINDTCKYCGDNSQINELIKVGKQSILSATGSGMLFYNFKTGSKKLYLIAKENNAELNQCSSILRDSENNIWIGTHRGLFKITNGINKFQADTKNQIVANNIRIKKILANTENEKIIFAENGSTILFIASNNQLSGKYQTPFETSDIINAIEINCNEYLISTWHGIFSFYRKGNYFEPCKYIPDSVSQHVCWGLLKDQHNNVWMGLGGGKGLYRYNIITKETKHFSQYNYAPTDARYLPIRNAMSIVEIDKHHIAFANNQIQNKLCIWDASTDIISEVHASNVQNNFEPYRGPIYTMIAGSSSNIWLATINGIVRYNLQNNTYIQYDKAEGLENSNTSAIAFDNRNNLWVGTNSGLFMLNTITGKFNNFKNDNTVNQLQIDYAFYDSLMHRMYINHNSGYLLFNPESLYTNNRKSKTYFEAIYVNQKPIAIKRDTLFENTENNFQFNFGALNLSDGSYNKFYYQLKPIDTKWHVLEYQRQINFSNLLPGEYIFNVTTKNNDGVWGLPVNYHFTIEHAYYQTWWFYLLCSLMVIAVVWQFIRIRLQQIERIYAIRNKLSRDLHDDIGSTLSSINILSRTAQNNLQQTDNEKTNNTLEKINERSQRLLTNMNDIIWNIKPTNDTMEEVLSRMREYATSLLEAKKINFEMDFPAEKINYKLTLETKSNLYLIFKEAVNNLAKYSGATQAKLSLTFDNAHIHMKIEDNGAGFNINELRHRGGLTNMQHRAEEMKGKLKIESVIGQGTVVELVL
ncbi:MAG: hypothetical protein IPO27_05280 [Bacteroidetes bacterium]|nr:hypothetical protein [Bacteroidota bacterium]